MPPDAEFVKRLLVLAEVMGESLSELRIAGYWAALSDLASEDTGHAMDRALKECRFFPRPAEIRDMARDHAQRRFLRERERDDRRRRSLELPMSAEERERHEARVAQFLDTIKATVRAMPGPERRPHGRSTT